MKRNKWQESTNKLIIKICNCNNTTMTTQLVFHHRLTRILTKRHVYNSRTRGHEKLKKMKVENWNLMYENLLIFVSGYLNIRNIRNSTQRKQTALKSPVAELPRVTYHSIYQLSRLSNRCLCILVTLPWVKYICEDNNEEWVYLRKAQNYDILKFWYHVSWMNLLRKKNAVMIGCRPLF